MKLTLNFETHLPNLTFLDLNLDFNLYKALFLFNCPKLNFR